MLRLAKPLSWQKILWYLLIVLDDPTKEKNKGSPYCSSCLDNVFRTFLFIRIARRINVEPLLLPVTSERASWPEHGVVKLENLSWMQG